MSPETRRSFLGAGAALLGVGAGCSGVPRSGETATATQPALPADATYAYTHSQPTGNRVASAVGAVHEADPVDVPIGGTPAWLLGFGDATESRWVVVTEDGSVRTVTVSGSGSEVDEGTPALPAGMPPVARRTDAGIEPVRPPRGASRRGHPVVTDRGLLFVAEDGALVLAGPDGRTRFQVDAPRDIRIVRLDERRYATLGGATDRYDHGALGDTTEGGGLVVVDVETGSVATEREIGPPAVLEGLSPLVADVDGDGERELVVTTATERAGARVAAYAPDGTRLAQGPAIGGGGWRHQLCVAPFGPDDRPELAAVRKPHVEHRLEFYRQDGDRFRVVATLSGVRSHTYGSRNLDGALAADLDDDGRLELLVPRTARDELLAVERTGDGARVDHRLPLDGRLLTNLSAAGKEDGLALAAGTASGIRVWHG